MIIFGFILLAAYLFALGMLLYGAMSMPRFTSEEVTPVTRFSVVVPFRNEADNLPKLINSLLKQQYPSDLFEIILVNDASEDSSKAVLAEMLEEDHLQSTLQSDLPQHRILDAIRTSNAPKKDAITTAVSNAKNEWIITTDADCTLPKNWLRSFDQYIQVHNAVLIAGPVCLDPAESFLQKFQQLDVFSLQTTTMGSFAWQLPLLCNGANLAYKKQVFKAVNGFSGNDHIASGDDIFMLEKCKQYNAGEIHYLKAEDAIVSTQAQSSWKQVISQRVRWASKTANQKSWPSKLLGTLVILFNIWVLAGLVYICFNTSAFFFVLAIVLLKLVLDYLYLYSIATFFRSKLSLPSFLGGSILYPLLLLIILVKSLKGSYHWKGRNLKK